MRHPHFVGSSANRLLAMLADGRQSLSHDPAYNRGYLLARVVLKRRELEMHLELCAFNLAKLHEYPSI